MKRLKHLRMLSYWAVLLFAASGCSNDSETSVLVGLNNGGQSIHYVASINKGTDDISPVMLDSYKKYKFQEGDKLYIEGNNIYGVLSLTDGAGSASATFGGVLIYNGEGTPADDLLLNAILVGPSDALHTVENGRIIETAYPTTAIAGTLSEAVEKYSHLTASSTFSAKSFTLSQQSAFLNFDMRLYEGTHADRQVDVSISNNGETVRTGSVTTVADGIKIMSRFVAAFPAGTVGVTTLSDATIKVKDNTPVAFGGSTTLEADHIYNITKTIADPPHPVRYVKSADIGKVVAMDNYIYLTATEAERAGTQAVGMIASVLWDEAIAISLNPIGEDGRVNSWDYDSFTHSEALDIVNHFAVPVPEAAKNSYWEVPWMSIWQNILIACGSSGTYHDSQSDMPTTKNSFNYGHLNDYLKECGGKILEGDSYWLYNSHDKHPMLYKWYYSMEDSKFDYEPPGTYKHLRPIIRF